MMKGITWNVFWVLMVTGHAVTVVADEISRSVERVCFCSAGRGGVCTNKLTQPTGGGGGAFRS